MSKTVFCTHAYLERWCMKLFVQPSHPPVCCLAPITFSMCRVKTQRLNYLPLVKYLRGFVSPDNVFLYDELLHNEVIEKCHLAILLLWKLHILWYQHQNFPGHYQEAWSHVYVRTGLNSRQRVSNVSDPCIMQWGMKEHVRHTEEVLFYTWAIQFFVDWLHNTFCRMVCQGPR